MIVGEMGEICGGCRLISAAFIFGGSVGDKGRDVEKGFRIS